MRRRHALVGLACLAAGVACGGDAPREAGARDTLALAAAADTAGTPPDSVDGDAACVGASPLWRCRIAPGFAARVALVLAPADSAGEREVVALDVRAPGHLAGTQRLASPDAGWLHDPEPSAVTAHDLDGDGYRDLRVQHQYGIAANVGHYVWRWMPADRRFAYDSLLSEETNVHPDGTGCVATFGSVGHGGLSQTESRYCLTSGRWVEVARRDQRYEDEEERPDGVARVMEYAYERRGDSLVLVRKGEIKE